MYPCKYKVKRTSMGSPSVKVKTYLRRQKEGPSAIRKMLRMTDKRAMDATRVFFLLEERGEGGGAPHG